jgi:hypothetical protein
MRFGAGDKFVDGAVRRVPGKPLAERLRWNIGRAEAGIYSPADERHGEDRDHRDETQAEGSFTATLLLARSGKAQNPPSDLGAGLFGFGGLDQSAVEIAIELGQLIAIDLKVVRRIRSSGLGSRRERQQNRQTRAQCQDSGNHPEQHAA